MKLTIAQQLTVKETFVIFAKREFGITTEQAHEEFNRIMATPSVPKTRDAYIKTSRVGATFGLNRQQRVSLYMSLENALNHATF